MKVTDPTTLRLREKAKREAIAKGGPSAAPFLVDDTADDGATLWVKSPVASTCWCSSGRGSA
jgi:hypothetical protein